MWRCRVTTALRRAPVAAVGRRLATDAFFAGLIRNSLPLWLLLLRLGHAAHGSVAVVVEGIAGLLVLLVMARMVVEANRLARLLRRIR